jgi:hypothetical protein
MKSMVQTWLGAIARARGSRSWAARRRLGALARKLKPSWRYSRATLAVDLIALAPQEHMDAPIAVAHARCHELPNAHAQGLVERVALAAVAHRRPAKAHCQTDPTLAYAIARLQLADQDAPPGRL